MTSWYQQLDASIEATPLTIGFGLKGQHGTDDIHLKVCCQYHLRLQFYLQQSHPKWPLLNFASASFVMVFLRSSLTTSTLRWLKAPNCSSVCMSELINKKMMDDILGTTQSTWNGRNGMSDIVYLWKLTLWEHRRSRFIRVWRACHVWNSLCPFVSPVIETAHIFLLLHWFN